MRLYGVIGWKNSGKTSLMERLVAEITARGFSVSTVKHVHHDVDLDQPGKDSYRHRAAGAREVILASRHRFALLREHRGDEPDLTAVLARLAPVDLVLVEGYKRDAHPKIEVFRREAGHDLIQPGDALVRAVATDAALDPLPVPVLDLNDTAAIADFILREVGLLPTSPFNTVVVVDWSASATPSPATPSPDAIWIGVARTGQTTTTYHPTRCDAEAFLCRLLDTEKAAKRRVLLGFDFPMGYPQGFAARLTGRAEAKAKDVWDWLDRHITDSATNANNRFAVANQINALFHQPGPFWGRPTGTAYSHLTHLPTTKPTTNAFAERRDVEKQVPHAQPVWKLFYIGSVGSQSLMGLPLIHRLSCRPGAQVWPFDAPTGPLVLAEVYPSLLASAVAVAVAVAAAVAAGLAPIKDEVQVRLLASALWTLSHAGSLAPLFDTPSVAQEEGWILGVGHEDLLHEALLEANL